MLYLILILFIIAIVAGYISGNNKDQPVFYKKGNETLIQSSKSYDDYYIGYKCISLYSRKGYSHFRIAGVYYRNLPIETVGKFNGYAVAKTDNKYDPYAIEVYNDARTHVGFLPRGNKSLHAYILNNGGSVHAYGYIGYNDTMYGEVCVEADKTLVRQRNKPYLIN